MLNFLRKLRRKEMDNKTGRYLKYAIGEIFLVMIGILLALTINNLNEKRKLRIISDKTLSAISNELKEALETTNNALDFNLKVVNTTKSFLEETTVIKTDSAKQEIIILTVAFAPLQLSIPIIEQELGSEGKLTDHDNLLKAFRDIKSQLLVLDQSRYYLDEFWNSTVITYLKNQKVMLSFLSSSRLISREIDGIAKLYDQPEYKDIIAMEYLHLASYTNEMSNLKTKLLSLQESLKTN